MDNLFNFLKKFIPKPVFNLFQPVYHYLLAFLGAFIYGFPSRKVKVIGVTGTKGKSTTVYFLSKILEEAGHKTAAISTIEFKIGNVSWPNSLKMTMPGRFKIQSFLRKAVKSGCKSVVLEVSSQGVAQSRHKFINFDAAIFTNLSPEHIEAHGSFENYKRFKLKFFKYVKNNHIINKDDKYFEDFYAVRAKNKFAYSIADAKDLKLKLIGDFNLINAAAAIKTAEIYGVRFETAKTAIENVENLPGRMELINEGQNFKVVVDYAHTPDSLIKVYESLKANHNLICVLGACGGGRDRWKRPEFGKIASAYCNYVILTNEDPYDENPEKIIEDIFVGVSQNGNVYKIIDRREAIAKAIGLAKSSDAVVITGKGSESVMMMENGKKVSFDDREAVKDEIIKRRDSKM